MLFPISKPDSFGREVWRVSQCASPLQSGPLLVTNGVITPINRLLNWKLNWKLELFQPYKRSCNPTYNRIRGPLCEASRGFQVMRSGGLEQCTGPTLFRLGREGETAMIFRRNFEGGEVMTTLILHKLCVIFGGWYSRKKDSSNSWIFPKKNSEHPTRIMRTSQDVLHLKQKMKPHTHFIITIRTSSAPHHPTPPGVGFKIFPFLTPIFIDGIRSNLDSYFQKDWLA